MNGPVSTAGLPALPSFRSTLESSVKSCKALPRRCGAGPDGTHVARERRCWALAQTDIPTVDITGGAPELNPHFRWLVEQAHGLKRHVMDRCNLSVLPCPRPTWPDFWPLIAEIIASLPYYKAPQTDAQRGEGVFDKSMEALRRLNQLGYGTLTAAWS